MSNRRLWMVNHYAVDGSSPGGTRHIEMARILKSKGWDTTIFASAFDHQALRFHIETSWKKPFHRTAVDGVDFVWIHSTPYSRNDYKRYVNMLSFMALAIIALLTTRSKPDAIIGSSPHLLAPVPARVAAWLYRVPFMLEIRDVWPESLIQMGLRNPAIVKPLEVIERFLYLASNEIIGLTNGVVKEIRKKTPSHIPVNLVPNGVSSPQPVDAGARSLTRAENGWLDKVVAIYAGAHGPTNDLGVIVNAARLLRDRTDIQFVLIGDGPVKESLVESAVDLPNVTFMNSMPKAEAIRMVKGADIGLMVYKDVELFRGARPNKLFDYMSAAIPLANNMDGEARELVAEANAGLFATPENAAELARIVVSLADDPEKRALQGNSGLDWLIRTHTRERAVDDLLVRLNTMISRHTTGRRS